MLYCLTLKRNEEGLDKSKEDLKLSVNTRKEFNMTHRKNLINEENNVKDNLKRNESHCR